MNEYEPSLWALLFFSIGVVVCVLFVWIRQNRGGGWADERHVKFWNERRRRSQ